MTTLVTGAGGFIGGRLVRRLRSANAPVRAIVRSDRSAAALRAGGCEVIVGDILDTGALGSAVAGCETVLHLAGDYRVGIGPDEVAGMVAANVTATERVLDAAIAAGATRIVHVSTVNAFGDTAHRVVDEGFERATPARYLSVYDETKHRAHVAAERRIADGAPVAIAMPGGVYGPDDPSSLGGVLRDAAAGRLRAVTFGDLGMTMAHVDDVAAGIALVGERGAVGERYILGGEVTTLAELIRRVAAINGHRAPRLTTPTWLLRAAAPIGRLVGRNVGELVGASAGVTYWASGAKARRELGWAPRDLETGLTEVFGPNGG